MKNNRKNKGITLIALVITIIILLILAGITISALTNTGIFQKTSDAKHKTEYAQELEKVKMAAMSALTGSENYEITTDVLNKELQNEFKLSESDVTSRLSAESEKGPWKYTGDKGKYDIDSTAIVTGKENSTGPGEIIIGKENASLIGYTANNMEELNIPDQVTKDGKKYTVVGIDSYTFEDDKTLKKVTIPNTVRNIEKNVLRNCVNLEEVYVPASTTDIGDNFVYACPKLKKIDIDDNNPTYKDIDGVCYSKDEKMLIAYPPAKDCTEYIIPDTVEILGSACLAGTNIKNIKLASNINKIETAALSNCTSLSSIIVDTEAFSYADTICSGCKNLTNVELNNKCKGIPSSAFSNCTALKNINLPDTVKKIGAKAFMDCISLEQIKLPNTMEIIENNTFYNCEILKNIELPDSLEEIRQEAFGDCEKLGNIEIKEKLYTIGEAAFSNAKANIKFNKYNNIDNVGDYAFGSCNIDDENAKNYINNLNNKALQIPYSGFYITDIKGGYHFNRTINKAEVSPNKEHKVTSIKYDWSQLSDIAKLISENSDIDDDTAEINFDVNGEKGTIGVGDTIKLNGKTVRIIGFNHDELNYKTVYGYTTRTGKAGISFEFCEPAMENELISENQETSGVWGKSPLRAKLNDTFYNTLDNRRYIKKVRKLYGIKYDDDKNLKTSQDFIWLLSSAEIWSSGIQGENSRGLSLVTDGSIYNYYKDVKVWHENDPKLIKRNSKGEAKSYLLRSLYFREKDVLCSVYDSGGVGGASVHQKIDVFPGFAI